MQLTKIETNFRRKLFFHESKFHSFQEMCSHFEKELIFIYPELKYQEILGFGGALTEASAYNFSLLPQNKKTSFLEDYFGNDGIAYSFCRACIGSCDFSLSPYSYLYEDDINTFSIEQDKKYVIPFIQECMKANPDLILLASPWSPPAFMKSNKKLTNGRNIVKRI